MNGFDKMKMMNLQTLMTLNQSKEKFMVNHPQVQPFLDDVNRREPEVGQEVAIAVRYPDGTEYKTGVRVTEGDLDLLNTLRQFLR
jgi:hypothetical protein